jgi:hypothetical protein
MLRLVLAALFGFTLMGMASSKEAYDGNDIFENCQPGSSLASFCNGYFIGAIDALSTRGVVFCTPDGMTAEQSSLQPDEAFDVVDEVGEPDLESCPSESDGSDEEAHSVLLLCEDMLDARPHSRLAAIGAADRRRHRAADGLLAMDPTGEAVARQERLVLPRAVGSVGPHG